jgi:hypothetical protein
MNPNYIYFPCLAMLVLSFIVAVKMFFARVAAVKAKHIQMTHFKTYNDGVTPPAEMIQAGRNFTNLFEVPTLFYMVCAFALITHSVDTLMIITAWTYVVCRCVHSYIHITHNKLRTRMKIYTLSWLVLLFMGLLVAVRILLGS